MSFLGNPVLKQELNMLITVVMVAFVLLIAAILETIALSLM